MLGDMADHEDDWLEPEDDMGLWEYQLHPLTIEWLRTALAGQSGDLPVEVAFYDGTDIRPLVPVHIDVKGTDSRATAVVITVAEAASDRPWTVSRRRPGGGAIA